MSDYAIIGYSIFLGTLFVGGAIITSKLLAFWTPHSDVKVQPYECSEDPVGSARIQFKVGFYIFALLFLVFDVETLFLFPCVKVFRSITAGTMAAAVRPATLFVELGLFILILSAALVYAWKKGVLVWE